MKDRHLAHLKEYFGKIQISRTGGSVTGKNQDRSTEAMEEYAQFVQMHDAVMAGELTYD